MIIQAVDLAKVSGKLFFMHEKDQQAKTEIISNGIQIQREFFSRKQARRKVPMGRETAVPAASHLGAQSWPQLAAHSGLQPTQPQPNPVMGMQKSQFEQRTEVLWCYLHPPPAPSSLLLSQSKPVTLILSPKKITSLSVHRSPDPSLKIAG